MSYLSTTTSRLVMQVTCAALLFAAGGLQALAAEATTGKVLAALPNLELLAQGIIDRGEIPGLAIAIVHNDEIVYLKGFGLRAAGAPDEVDADTVFQIASLSKPIAATIVASLVSDGIISWDSRISDLDPDFSLTRGRSDRWTDALLMRDHVKALSAEFYSAVRR